MLFIQNKILRKENAKKEVKGMRTRQRHGRKRKNASCNVRYYKPNMNNLKGKQGKRIIEEIRKLPVSSIDDIRAESHSYIEKALTKKNG